MDDLAPPSRETVDLATGLLRQVQGRDASALERLLHLVYDDMHLLAEGYLRRERAGHTLQPTALVNEAFVRLVKREDLSAAGREQFLAIAAQAMRRILVEHARRRNRARRGGAWRRVTLHEPETPGRSIELELVELNDVLDRLSLRDERSAKVVELRFFGGLTIDEIAGVLGVSSGTVDNDWYAARAWLLRELGHRKSP